MDASEERIYTETIQPNLQDVLDANTAWRNAERFSSRLTHSDYVKVASVPFFVLQEWWTKYRINPFAQDPETQAKIAKLLNDSEWNKVRTAPGRI